MPETTVEQCIEQLQAWCRDPTLKIAHSALHRTGAAGKGAFAEVDTATWNQETQREETDAANQPPSPSLSSALSNKIMASRPVASSSQITVAVKRFKPEVLANDTNLKLLVSEIGILLSTRHRHIIQVYGLGTRGDGSDIRRSLYLVQEYAPGGTMKRLIMEQMMNWNAFGITGADLLEWCHQLASVLAYLHGKSPPIVHRDIKSENILFSAPLAQWGMPKRQKSMSGRIKNLPTTAAEVRLIDFGLARRLPTVTKQIQAETPIVEQGSARNIEKEMAWTKSFKSVKSLRIIADAASANGPSSNHPSREPSVRHSSASKSRTEKRGVSFSNVSVTRKHVSLGGAAVAGVADDQSFSDKRKSPLAEDQPSFSPTGQDLPSTSLYSNAATPASDASPLLAAATAAEGKEAVPLISPAKGDFNPFAPYLRSSVGNRSSAGNRSSVDQRLSGENKSMAPGPEASHGSLFMRAVSAVKNFTRTTGTASPKSDKVQELFDLTGNTGSLLYMAPEVFMGQSYNEKVDVFSFAMVMYELLHRRLILTSILEKNMGADAEEMEQAIVDYAAAVAGGYRPPLSPNLPDSIVNLLSMCWSDKPEDRPSAEAIADKLARILETEDISSLNKSPQGGCGCCG